MAIQYDSPSSLSAGLRCRCPRCGEGKLFQGFLTIAPACAKCGQSFAFADPADGPAFFVMSGVGIVVTALWAWWAVVAQPPIWAQMAVVFPAMIGGCLASLRPVKAWLVAEQYLHKAGEGQWASLGKHGEGGFVLDRRKASGG
ncbi:DUF983 domain-containing protein [Phenylobacterium sp.]|jgi:uncharacterized protein (DUF983 family)|uniref:DUF983 domain-containing protein n=1 Tax=Phenylobacterium sp. TaxID=1871053 RepID=UPI002F95C439